MNYQDGLNLFYKDYAEMEEKDRIQFARIMNKLLSVNFICCAKQNDRNDYFFISRYQNVFKGYLNIMDYDFEIFKSDEVVAIHNRENYNRYHFKLNESLMLLILRKLYYAKMNEISLSNDIKVRIGEIQEELLSTGRFDKRIGKKELRQVMALMKRFNLIDAVGDVTEDDTVVIIYPSILYAVSINTIEELERKIKELSKGEGKNEENYQDQAH